VDVHLRVHEIGPGSCGERDRCRALVAAQAPDRAAAVTQARSARSLDPVSVEPLLAEGLADERRGRSKAARRLYLDAVALQPENWRTWYELGQFEFYELEALDDAFLDLDKAYSLDPWGPSAAAVQKVRDTLEGR